MKSIFITGIAGMLGSNLAYLLKDAYHISGVDLNNVQIRGVNSHLFSAFDLEKIRELFLQHKVDVLIHCAALVNVDECEEKPDYAQKVNYELTKNLAELCRELKVKMIFISTDAVFDGNKEGLYKETDLPGPISVYAATKLQAEQYVQQFSENIVVRTNIYGFNYREKNSFGEWIISSLNNNDNLSMFYDIYFSPILVNELASILSMCIDRNLCGLYHICSTGSISKYEIAIAIMEEFKLSGAIFQASMEDHEFRAPRTKNMGLSNEKISKELGIHISTPLEGVKEFKRLYDRRYHEQLKKG
ncbi:MAG: hypothetical protein K0R00_736 [Herbinix sp.]|jgi:dTDP-4-dehydrorhamnose reductase|nr:hypothetical protein [Herbinix sp.]